MSESGSQLDAIRRAVMLSTFNLWLRYFAMGGRADLQLVTSYLNGTGELSSVEHNTLVQALNELEASPWGEYANGKGLTTHRLAALFKGLGVGPRLGRSTQGVVRGYWYADLAPVFRRFPSPEVLQPLPPLQGSPDGAGTVAVVTPVTVQAELTGLGGAP